MTAASTRRRTSAVAILLGVALVVGVNWLGARHWWRGDWTSTRLYSISETTRKTVSALKEPVRVTVFMRKGAPLYQPISEILNRYRALSPKIEVEYLDPERNPARAQSLVQEFGIKQNTVVFQSGNRKKYVEEDKLADFDFAGAGMGGAPEIKAFRGEEAFTSAILDVTDARVPKIYFTTGHGEPTIESTERLRGFAEAKQALERQNRTVAGWDSLGKGNLPADATVVVVAGPRTALLEPELTALSRYLAGGGRLLVLADPVIPGPGAPPSDYGLGPLLGSAGLRLSDDIVIDPANAVPQVGAETVIANRYGSHPVVRSLSSEQLPVVFPLARSVAKTDKPPAGWSQTMLVETTPDGWGETSLDKLDEVKKDPADHAGPVAIAMAGAPADPKNRAGRLIVFGNSRFAANGALANAGNANLFLNSVSWLAGQERLVGIAPKTPEQASLPMTRSQVNRLGILAVFGMPVFAILAGVWVWYRRRD
ncbi:MAG TPA: GldG family protein [Thermoanaerobaculia bacterium]|nr:GldG family protein [Thermoanaerobaculia bacterium]